VNKYLPLIAASSVFFLLFVVVTFYGVSTHNTAISLESQFEAVQNDNKNQYDNMVKKIMKSAQVTKKQAEFIGKIIIDHAKSRGGSGPMTLVNAVKESIPTIPDKAWTNLQNIITSSHDRFASAQTRLLDIKREHDILRMSIPSSFIVGGRNELEAIIVTSSRTENAFTTGKDDDMELGL
jgi:hypothetical protein